jgi:hypothetical protein
MGGILLARAELWIPAAGGKGILFLLAPHPADPAGE